MNETVHDYMQSIRDFINEPRHQHGLLKNKDVWFQLCACLDVIEDAEIAVATYPALEAPNGDGLWYLAVYGVLQALYIQQNAVTALCGCLGVPIDKKGFPKLTEIRQIRSNSIGHPERSTSKGVKGFSYHSISRISLERDGFDLVSSYSDGRSVISRVSTLTKIAEQQTVIVEVLALILQKCMDEDKAHREQFRMEKLDAILNSPLGYHMGKVFEGVRRPELVELSLGNLKIVESRLQEFLAALKRRGIELDTYDSIKETYRLLDYPIAKLRAFLGDAEYQEQPDVDEEAAYIFAYFIARQIDGLREVAKEIDEEYAT